MPAAVAVAAAALGACGDTRPSKAPSAASASASSGADAVNETTSSKSATTVPGGGASGASGASAAKSAASVPPGPVSSSAMPPPTPRKAGCLDSTRGAKHTFVGKLEPHPDGSGNWRVHLPKKVCFSGGRFSEGTTDEIVLDIDDLRAKPLSTKKVKVSGTSQDFAPVRKFAYVIRLEVTSLAVTK